MIVIDAQELPRLRQKKFGKVFYSYFQLLQPQQVEIKMADAMDHDQE